MGKYSSYSSRPDQQQKTREIHPIWRGVGFALIVLIPILSYFGALVLFDLNKQYHWLRITPDMISPIIEPYFYIKAGLTLVLMFLLFAVFSLFSFALYQVFAPPRYGPYDVPPVQYRGKRYKR